MPASTVQCEKWPASIFLPDYCNMLTSEFDVPTPGFEQADLPAIQRLAHRAFGRCFRAIGIDYVELRQHKPTAKRLKAISEFRKAIKAIYQTKKKT